MAAAPSILASPSNQAPACATPGRLMAFLKDHNRRLSARYANLASHYIEIGTRLGIRWDYAFFQMVVETGYLKYTGDVRARQNNFAGIAATGGGVRGESFSSVEDGVRAHLQHLLVYADVPVANPVAERTRKVQAWGVYKGWPGKLGRPVNFRDMAAKWAPGSRGYWRSIHAVARRFMDERCSRPDPQPELMANLQRRNRPAAAPKQPTANPSRTGGAELARKAVERARKQGATRSALGANQRPPESKSKPAVNTSNVAILNRGSAQTPATTTPAGRSKSPAGANPSNTTTKSVSNGTPSQSTVGRFASNFIAVPSANKSKEPTSCRVWQASYGGSRAVIIKSIGANHVNYTVLDVNQAREKREIDAYVAAYAKGGKTVGRFATQAKALAKAFQLCPSAAKQQ